MRYFGEDVPGVSQVRNKDNLLFSPHLLFSVVRVSPRIRPSVTRTMREPSQCWEALLSSTPPILILKNGSYKLVFLRTFLTLRFCFRPIGVPGLLRVTIHNINSHSSIQMLSISGNTIHFHCSFFEDKVSWTINSIVSLSPLSRR